MRKMFERLFGGWFNQAAGKQPSAPDLQTSVAALLLCVGMADFQLSAEERGRAATLVETYFRMPAGGSAEVMEQAARQLQEKTDIYTFTSQIEKALTRDERIPIMEMVWQIIFADRRLDGHEDQVAHRLAGLLGLDHSQMIAAKIKIRNELG